MRLRLTAPKGGAARVRYLDSVHGALVNAWTACGARGEDVVGRDAGNWSFGAVGTARPKGFILKSLVVGAEGGPLETVLGRIVPETVRKTSMNGDVIDLSAWSIHKERLPVVGELDEVATLPAVMLSPLVLSVRGQKGRWHDDLKAAGSDLEAAVNFRLSRLSGRATDLRVSADRLYLRANPRHSTRVRVRAVRGRPPAFVIGMLCPLVITGPVRDLRSAWALGIGEKNRYGFGCIGHAGSVA